MTVHGVTIESEMSKEIEYSGPSPAAGGVGPEEAVHGVPAAGGVGPEEAVHGVPAAGGVGPEEAVQGVPAAGGVGPEEAVQGVPEEPVQGLPEEPAQGVPVLAEVRPIDRAPASIPAVQAAAAAATGFVAGAATIALVRRRSARRLTRSHRNAPRRPVDMLPIVGSRTFLIDVHLVAKPD